MDTDLRQEYIKLDDWSKVEFLTQLEFKENSDKWLLIDSIITDVNEYDLARIEAFKILEIADIPQYHKNILAKSLFNILISEDDYDIKNYAACALVNFIEYSFIEQLCIERLLDPEEDIDLRYCFFTALLKMKNRDELCKILKELLSDADFSRNAKCNLEKLFNISSSK